ncbi:MAG: hypothetical protein ACPKNR_02545 [Pleomorphochaeta sp.]
MKKKVLLLALILLTTVFSLTAKSVTIRIAAYVPEKITFEQTDNSFEVKTNMDNVRFDFFDSEGDITDAYDADVLLISAL